MRLSKAPDAPAPQLFDRVLVAVGREAREWQCHQRRGGGRRSQRSAALISVDRQMRTNVAHILPSAISSARQCWRTRPATRAKSPRKSRRDARPPSMRAAILPVAYTDPEIAWTGLTETDAKARGVQYGKGMFPWAASGRTSPALNRDDGFTKLLFDKQTNRILGAGIVGTNAGDLIAEVALAIEMGADATDIGLTIHPHPTLSETVAFAAEAFDGTLTDLYIPKRTLDPCPAIALDLLRGCSNSCSRHRRRTFAGRGVRGLQMGCFAGACLVRWRRDSVDGGKKMRRSARPACSSISCMS